MTGHFYLEKCSPFTPLLRMQVRAARPASQRPESEEAEKRFRKDLRGKFFMSEP